MKRLRLNALKLFFLIFAAMCYSSTLFADTAKIKDVKVINEKEGIRFHISLDQPLREAPEIDLFRNIIQLSFKNVQAWPSQEVKEKTAGEKAKTLGFEKMIAYQYNPEVARVRILFNSESERFKEKVRLTSEGRAVELFLPAEAGESQGVAAVRDQVKSAQSAPTSTSRQLRSPVEQEIIQEVMKEEPSSNNAMRTPAGVTEETETHTKEKSVIGVSSFAKTFFSLFAVVALIVLAAFAFKKFYKKGSFPSLIGRNKHKVINVIESHFIGPKKTISLVKVANQYFLVGVTGESINGIGKVENSSELQRHLDQAMTGENFEEELVTEAESPDPKTFKLKESQKRVETDDDLSELAKLALSATNSQEESLFEGGSNYSSRSVKTKIRKKLNELRPL